MQRSQCSLCGFFTLGSMTLNARPSATLSPPAISGKLVWLLATARQRSHLTEPPGCTSPYLECGAEDRA